MARWVAQSERSSATALAEGRTEYLTSLVPRVDALVREYHARTPEGEDVTLHVLEGIGRAALGDAAEGRSFDRVKQDMGLLVAIRLVVMHGAGRVETRRAADGVKAATRKVSSEASDWVRSYTPHRLRS